MENEMILKIIGVQVYNGLSRSGEPYSLYTLDVDHGGEKCKIKTFLDNARPGDFTQIVIGTRKNIYGAEFAVLVSYLFFMEEIAAVML